MDVSPELVAKEYIVLRSREATQPELMTDGQLLSQLKDAQQEATLFGDETLTPAHDRLTRLLDEARHRCLITGA